MADKLTTAFLKGVASITDTARLAEIERALDIGPDAVLRVLNIEDAAFGEYRAEILRLYGQSGEDTVRDTKWKYGNGQRAVVRWNTLSPRAERYAREVIGTKITNITREAMQNVRDTVADGYAFNRSRNRIATDLIGRLGPDGKRVGGVIGISEQQRIWVGNMRDALETDPALALRYTKRDKRFDKLLRSSSASGKPLTMDQIDRITRQYSDKLLKSRALTISRTEASAAIENGKYEAWRQGLEKTGVPERFLIRTWNHRGLGMKDRPSHIAMNGVSVRGLQVPFVLNDGTAMMHPHDSSYGAGPDNVINCRCVADYTIDRKGYASSLV